MKKKQPIDAYPKVGIGVLILKNGQVPLALRKGAHGAGEYAFPGGHMEFGESFADCARREVIEETGMQIKNIRFQLLANLKTYSGKHYVHIGLLADWKSGEPQQKEPDKSEPWQWYTIDKLPKPLFATCEMALKSLRNGKNYFDS